MKRRARWIVRCGIAIVALELVYLLAGNLFLSTALSDRLLDARLKRLRVEWERAWTLLPGVVRLRGVTLQGEARRVRWAARLGSARIGLFLPALAGKELRAGWVEVEGLDFRLHRRLGTAEDPEGVPASWPPMPIREAPGLPDGDTRPRELRPRNPWRLILDDIRVRGVEQVWIDGYRLRGEGTIGGELLLTVGSELEVPRSRLEVAGASLTLGDDTLAREMTLEIDGRLDPFQPGAHGGRAILGFLSGQVELAGEIAGLDFLEGYLTRLPGLALEGAGTVSAELRLERGELEAGSRLEVDAGELEAGFLDYLATGSGAVEVRVEGPEEARLEVLLSAFRVRRLDASEAHLEGRDLLLRVRSRSFSLDRAPEDLEAEVELPGSTVEDLAFYNRYIPAGLGLEILSGRGTVSGHFRLAEDQVRGEMRLTTQGLVARRGDVRMAGALELHTRLRSDEPRAGGLDLSGTTLRLTRVAVREGRTPDVAEDWWATVELPRAVLERGPGMEVRGRVQARLRDSGPLATLLAEGRAVDWLDRLFTVEDVRVDSELEWTRRVFAVEALEIRGEGLEVLGRLRLEPGLPRGLLFFDLGPLAAAVEIRGKERIWRFRWPRKWFEERLGATPPPASHPPRARSRFRRPGPEPPENAGNRAPALAARCPGPPPAPGRHPDRPGRGSPGRPGSAPPLPPPRRPGESGRGRRSGCRGAPGSRGPRSGSR